MAYVKSMLGSTVTLESEPKEPAKDKTEGSRLKRTTLMSFDKPSHDLIANDCLLPVEPVNGLAAANIVTVGPTEPVRFLI